MAKKTPISWLHETTLRITRVHFAFVATYAITIIIFDSWNLLTHQAVSERWTAATLLFVLVTLLWYGVRLTWAGPKRYLIINFILLSADIAFAGWNVFTQRGMASKAVMLFAVPIVSSALLRSRSTLLTVTTISAAVYSLASVRYFNAHYGEGFRVELYGEIFFYSALMFVLAWLLLILIEPKKS